MPANRCKALLAVATLNQHGLSAEPRSAHYNTGGPRIAGVFRLALDESPRLDHAFLVEQSGLSAGWFTVGGAANTGLHTRLATPPARRQRSVRICMVSFKLDRTNITCLGGYPGPSTRVDWLGDACGR